MGTDHKAPSYVVFSTPVTSSFLGNKYLPQHPIPEHPTFLPHYKRPTFTPIRNNRQNYSS